MVQTNKKKDVGKHAALLTDAWHPAESRFDLTNFFLNLLLRYSLNLHHDPISPNTGFMCRLIPEDTWVQVGLETWASMLTALVELQVSSTVGCLEKSTFIKLPHHGFVECFSLTVSCLAGPATVLFLLFMMAVTVTFRWFMWLTCRTIQKVSWVASILSSWLFLDYRFVSFC